MLVMILLLVASGYVAGRVHGQYGYRMGYRLGYRQGFVDADRGQEPQARPTPPSRTMHPRLVPVRAAAVLDLGEALPRHRAQAAAQAGAAASDG